MLSPCKNCPKKGCGAYHAECEKYLEFKQYREEVRKKEKDYNTFYNKEKRKWKKTNW